MRRREQSQDQTLAASCRQLQLSAGTPSLDLLQAFAQPHHASSQHSCRRQARQRAAWPVDSRAETGRKWPQDNNGALRRALTFLKSIT